MKITYLGHAGWFVETGDVTILCDPWNSKNPAFYGSWYAFPFNDEINWDKYLKPDILYVSHVHQDHFSEKTLELIDKDTQIIIPDYTEQLLLKKFKKLGFNNFTFGDLSVGLTEITTHVSETPNRSEEDSAICIYDGDRVFLNLNDAELDQKEKNKIKNKYPSVDILTKQFSGASWFPYCYEQYEEEYLQEISKKMREASMQRFKEVVDFFKADKIITSAGPPAFLHDEIFKINDLLGESWTKFPDCWQTDFKMNNVYKLTPECEFTYETLESQPRPFDDKKEYLLLNKKRFFLNKVDNYDYPSSKKKFIEFMNEFMGECGWLKRFININIYVLVSGDLFEINFNKDFIRLVEHLPKSYYLVEIPEDIFCDLVDNEEADWEIAFLSCRCKFSRSPDLYNSWILAFFRNFNKDLINNVKRAVDSHKIPEGTFCLNGYKIQRFCPHMNFDLEIYGEIDEKNKTIKCGGHCWEWDLNTGKGINNTKNIRIKKENKCTL